MEDRGFSDLFQTASTFISSQSNSHSQPQPQPQPQHNPSDQTSPPSSHAPAGHHGKKPSYGEVYSSAHVLLNAAKAKLHKGDAENGATAEDFNMGKLAGAAGTLIGAATHYGNLDSSKYGKYAQKAEEYLHSYEMKHGNPGASAGHSAAQGHKTTTNSSQSQEYYESAAQGHKTTTNSSQSQEYYESRPQGYPAPPPGYPVSEHNQGRTTGYS